MLRAGRYSARMMQLRALQTRLRVASEAAKLQLKMLWLALYEAGLQRVTVAREARARARNREVMDQSKETGDMAAHVTVAQAADLPSGQAMAGGR